MILAAAALTMGTAADAQTMIHKNDIKVENHLMTPEALWAMGRILYLQPLYIYNRTKWRNL